MSPQETRPSSARENGGRAGTRKLSMLAAGGLSIASLLWAVSPASAKIPPNLYEEQDVPVVMDSAMAGHVPPAEMKVQAVPVEDSADTALIPANDPGLPSKASVLAALKSYQYKPTALDENNAAGGNNTKEKVNSIKSYVEGQSAQIAFVGKLDQKYPAVLSSAGVTGPATRVYNYSTSNMKSVVQQNGWTIGGSLSVSLGPASPAQATFGYSNMTTTTNQKTETTSDSITQQIPEKAEGWLDARFQGAWYKGWIAYQDMQSANASSFKIVPARVLYKTSDRTTPITWMQMGQPLAKSLQ
ncbi:hypothetical protein [Streptomyces sioyaensis]|uniref:hypothetical protein n=1 Tax=Streptomyces sioyaensis TaxID=67364 RepID=UPI0036EF9ED9